MYSNEGMLSLDECEKKEFVKNPVDQYYKVISIVGRGNFGIIRKLEHLKTGKVYAAKCIKKKTLAENFLPSIHHEIAVLRNCKSASIVSLHKVFENASHVTLILEFMNGGDLQKLCENKNSLSEIDAKTVIAQVLEGVRTLHAKNIAHMDIKLENILLTKPNCLDGIKLCDFGISKYIEPGKIVRANSGTLDYISPELLRRDPITLKSDIWSIGVLTYSLVYGYTPFGDDSENGTMLNILKGSVEFDENLYDCITVECMNFIKSALRLEPKLRPTVDELLWHVWFSHG